PASVQKSARRQAAPDDHFAAGPHCGVIGSLTRLVGGAGGCPTIRAGVISPAGAVACRAPDDHFAAGPDCGVLLSRGGRVDNARWRQRVIGTRINLWKSIGGFA